MLLKRSVMKDQFFFIFLICFRPCFWYNKNKSNYQINEIKRHTKSHSIFLLLGSTNIKLFCQISLKFLHAYSVHFCLYHRPTRKKFKPSADQLCRPYLKFKHNVNVSLLKFFSESLIHWWALWLSERDSSCNI